MREDKNILVLEFDLNTFTKAQVIKAAIQSAHELDMPIALWQLPHNNEIHFITSEDSVLHAEKVDFSEIGKGFVFSKFETSSDSNLFIKGDYHLSFNYGEIVEKRTDNREFNTFKNRLKEHLSTEPSKTKFFTRPYLNSETVNYHDLVKSAIEAISAGLFEKVVTARSKDVKPSDKFDVTELFLRLTRDYENAFISFVSIPEVGSWLAATPEILIEKEGPMFRTVFTGRD